MHTFYYLTLNPVILSPELTFVWFFMVLVGGLGSMLGVVFGTVLLTLAPELLGFAAGQTVLAIGILLIAVTLFAPRGFVGLFSDLAKAVFRTGAAMNRGADRFFPCKCLKVFGGLAALANYRFVRSGEVCGVIGPNGAGKSTLFDLISGAKAASGGADYFRNSDRWRTMYQRARMGIIRTFQLANTFDSLTVEHNVLIGAEDTIVGNCCKLQRTSAPITPISRRPEDVRMRSWTWSASASCRKRPRRN